MRFIGSKVQLLDKIKEVIDENVNDQSTNFCDLFSGTSSVARYFKQYYQIISNDIMHFSYVLQKATIENNEIPEFRGLIEIGISDPIEYLNTTPLEGRYLENEKFFFSNNYAPSNICNRMYLTLENANRIDFIRIQIEEWKINGIVTENEYFYLLACLIEAVPNISNISGTYGAYLKHWDKRALNKLELENIDVINNNIDNKCYNMDANKLIDDISGDILYLDPPYNSRQYVPNYHLLETLSLYDSPKIKGVTGLRDYSEKKSNYCYKKNVRQAFDSLIEKANFKHILVSYSTDGLMSVEEIEEILKKYGNKNTYKLYKMPYRKYKSKHEQEKKCLYELIFYIEKDIKIKVGNTNKQIKDVEVNRYKKNTKTNKKYIKSPLNYIGGKYKILNQILPYFPSEIDTFVDLFAGGLNVSINIDANRIIANDHNKFIIDLFKEFKSNSLEDILNHIEGRIKEFGLSKTNGEGFNEFRKFYNENKNPLDLYTLVCYSFNYQFRFNNSLDYNNPFGRNRSQFSEALRLKLIRFISEYQDKNIELKCEDFNNFRNLELGKSDFVYCDPPYLITTGSYNDGNRGFKDWGEKEELELLSFLDYLNSKGVKFALSNVINHKGKENIILSKWSEKYKVIDISNDYSNSSHNTCKEKGGTREVLIINY